MKHVLMAITLTAATLVGCTGGVARKEGDRAAQRYQDYAGGPIDGFTIGILDSWTPVSQRQLVVWNGVNEAYLITVWQTCRNLQFADNIDFTSINRWMSTFESIRVDGDPCPISEIRPVNVKQMREDQRQKDAAAG